MRTQIITDHRLPRSKGYAHGVLSDAKEYIFIARQIVMNAEGEVVGKGDIVTQFAIAIRRGHANAVAGDLRPFSGFVNQMPITHHALFSRQEIYV